MVVIASPAEFNINENILNLMRDECNGVECCEHNTDSGWSSNPESDMTS